MNIRIACIFLLSIFAATPLLAEDYQKPAADYAAVIFRHAFNLRFLTNSLDSQKSSKLN